MEELDDIIKKLQIARNNPELNADDLTELAAMLISLSNQLQKS
ncbi:TPA: hypothetical protein ACGOVK_002149 [Streptococcus suis]|uniref:Uncharacterized protein n=1 Tax=Streptococcus suis TaxID=1307 RepID=A0A0Z8GTM5_STRSU|nr:hypothetical protein [Streptococcus suis]CYT95921.1 Uncharacterised protein [Streptococcus suis]CYU67690.1 Uncharacterised protein [Streptococcus suis]CYU77978.1 Uncharacterised protein [Streptococcus suis]CYV04740.1 Uncharacterised protein [Streptococcus suis]